MTRSSIDACISSKDSVGLCEAFPAPTPETVAKYTELAEYTLGALRGLSKSADDEYGEMLFIFYGDLVDAVYDYLSEYSECERPESLCALLNDEDRP